MSASIRILSADIVTLETLNANAWSYATKEVRDPQLSIGFLFRLVFNKWFITAMASALATSLLSYAILRLLLEILSGRFFLLLQSVPTILMYTLVLGERLTFIQRVEITTTLKFTPYCNFNLTRYINILFKVLTLKKVIK